MRVIPQNRRIAASESPDDEVPSPGRTQVSLDDVYATGDGRALMSGIQAMVRMVLEQRRLDRSRGLDTAAFVSGYEGSPLGGLDLEFGRARRRLDEEGVVFAPGLNEELAATAVAGTQLLVDVPGHDHDGVVGFWYGKNPGLDRAADAIRHGNYSGTTPLGGAVALIGDDPTCKSSTLPSSSVSMARSLSLPLLSPGSVADVVRLGLHAVALSRYSGLWAGLQIVADVADGSAVVDLGAACPEIPAPDTTRVAQTPLLVGPRALETEKELFDIRLPRALEYVRLASLNCVTIDSPRARLGIVAAGYTYSTTLRALEDMGLDAEACHQLGAAAHQDLRALAARPGRAPPPDRRARRGAGDRGQGSRSSSPRSRRRSTAAPGQPLVVGKVDLEGRPLVPANGSVDSDTVTRVLAARLPADGIPAAGRGPHRVAHPTASAWSLHVAAPPVLHAGVLLGLSRTTSPPAPTTTSWSVWASAATSWPASTHRVGAIRWG